MTRDELAPRAREQIRRIDEWWRAHRLAASDLFAAELIAALEALAGVPTKGAVYERYAGFEVRCVLLRRSQYRVYYSYDEISSLVQIRAVWHTARGRGPQLA